MDINERTAEAKYEIICTVAGKTEVIYVAFTLQFGSKLLLAVFINKKKRAGERGFRYLSKKSECLCGVSVITTINLSFFFFKEKIIAKGSHA